MLHVHLPVDDGDHVKQPEDDPRAEAEDGETGERDVQRGPRSHGHRREKLQWGFPKECLSHSFWTAKDEVFLPTYIAFYQSPSSL